MSLRWAIIGCGDIANKRVAPAINREPRSELIAVVRRHEESCRDFARRHGASLAITSFAHAITLDEVDVFYVATPVYLHAPQTIAAAEAGKHVLVEKPMALNTGECCKMIEACRANGVKLGVAYYRRFYEIYNLTQELIQSGGLGDIRLARVLVSEPYQIQPHEDGYWRVDPAQGGGGPLQDIGSHRIDLLLDLFGPVSEVTAVTGTSTLNIPVEDHVHVVIRFASGVEAVLTCAWHIAARRDEWEILGTRGNLKAAPLNGNEVTIEKNGRQEHRLVQVHENIHYPLIEDFTSAVLENREPRVTGEQGREVTRLIETAYESARQNRPVRMD